MKIRQVTAEHQAKVYALLRSAFPDSPYEENLVRLFHQNGTPLHEWVCIHTNKAIAYIAFTHAYRGDVVCGLHLAPMAVSPDFQKQGIGSELLRFALRQEAIKSTPLFVLGEPGYYRNFGFVPCSQPVCPYDTNNVHFLSLHNDGINHYTIGYEPEFKAAGKPSRLRKRRVEKASGKS